MSQSDASEAAAPNNVVAALAAVMKDLPGIGKSADPNAGITYAYRGIEAITREVQQLLGKYGVVFVPREIAAYIEPITVNNKPWTDNFLAVEYDVYGPGGIDDKITVGPIHVQGRDNSDKGYNKARTQAFKYALLQVLSIGDGKDDGDSASHTADERSAPAPEPPPAHILLATRIKELAEDTREKIKEFIATNQWPTIPNEWTEEQVTVIAHKVDALEQSAQAASATEDSPPPPPDAGVGGSTSGAGESPTPPTEWDRDSLLAGIRAYEERLDEKGWPVYTAWLTDVYGDKADLEQMGAPDLEQTWRKLDELTTEGVPA